MKIAIITWYDNLNFGTALQAFALQKYLEDTYNAEAYLIAYHSSEDSYYRPIESKFDHFFYKTYTKIKDYINGYIKEYASLVSNEYKPDNDERIVRFDKYLNEKIKFVSADNLDKLEEEFDLFICGSDQIWNPNILDKNFYLDFVKSKPKISYATSFGINYLPRFAKPLIKQYLENYRDVALREDACKAKLEKLTNRDIKVVCDPTLLLSKEKWESECKDELAPIEKYCITYFLGDTKLSQQITINADKELGMKNFMLPSRPFALKFDKMRNFRLGPDDFLALAKNTECIITDSFHAVCFAIIFEKPFCVIKKSDDGAYSQFSRIQNLLSKANLTDRIAYSYEDVFSIVKADIDYASVKESLNEYIDFSKNYLASNIY